jgi:hypothetical protein
VQAFPSWALEWLRAYVVAGGPLLDGPACAAAPDAALWRDRLQALLQDRYDDLACADDALCAAAGLQPSSEADRWACVRQVLRADALGELKEREATAKARAPLSAGNEAKKDDADKRVSRVVRAVLNAGLTADATDAELRQAAGIMQIEKRRYAYPVPGEKPGETDWIVRGKDVHGIDMDAVRERLKAHKK